ncbi:hypothetical protein [Novosphingobium kaempferiae]|uniref:hypothetical protein n=1 Tax=Novosphingobium kaempferiae TaxID=2896849 RepID=UPI001E46AE49|nr:hypothetical protein [Novosphingobium kaempferiae]
MQTTLSLTALREHLDTLEGKIPGYRIDGPYPPTLADGAANWEALVYAKGPFDDAGLRHAQNLIDGFRKRQPYVSW